jgi:hypothetical protein
MFAFSRTLAPLDASRRALPGTPAHWLELWSGAFALGWEQMGKMTALYDPRHFRSLWLADMRRLTSHVLQSPDFLPLMKFGLSLMAPPTAPPSAR